MLESLMNSGLVPAIMLILFSILPIYISQKLLFEKSGVGTAIIQWILVGIISVLLLVIYGLLTSYYKVFYL